MSSRRIAVFDTTLRDGEQSPGIALRPQQKAEVAVQLERLGVDVIEAGFAAASPGDAEGVRAVGRAVGSVTVAALARTRREDIDAAVEALEEAPRSRLHVFLATSPIHMEKKLRMTPDEVEAQAAASVAYARGRVDEVEFSCEDATRSEAAFVARVCAAAVDAGADVINLPDTTGYALPAEYAAFLREVVRRCPSLRNVTLSAHCHDDLGLAVANSLAAVEAGVGQVECTVNGIGERAGNAALEEIAMAMRVREPLLGAVTGVRPGEIARTSQLIERLTGYAVPPNKAIVGAGAWHTNEALVSFGFDKALGSPPKTVALLFDVFGNLGERHSVLGIFEYRGQTTEVVFTLAEPDYLFDVAFAGSQTAPPSDTSQPAAHRSNADDSPVWRFFKLGVEHILTGYDHLCFLLALLVVSRLRPLIAIVTSFTIAHSITLLLAAFGVVTLPTRFIECSIAVTIVYVAVENLRRSNFAHRWMLTFFFGLIHGFGFANTLNPQELPAQAKAKCLLVFNLGVEAGQLAVVLVLLPVSLALARWKHGPRAKIAISITVALLGLAWFLDRVFALGWMPF